MIVDTKAHYRRLVGKLGGIDRVQLLTGRKRQTIAAYHNQDNVQQPTAELMIELQVAADDFNYQRAINAVMGIGVEGALHDWRQAHASAYLDGEHDQRFLAAIAAEAEAAE